MHLVIARSGLDCDPGMHRLSVTKMGAPGTHSGNGVPGPMKAGVAATYSIQSSASLSPFPTFIHPLFAFLPPPPPPPISQFFPPNSPYHCLSLKSHNPGRSSFSSFHRVPDPGSTFIIIISFVLSSVLYNLRVFPCSRPIAGS